ncbi:HVA22-like protein k isoform X2 [Cucumis sativus]|uniref:HVA22-like protein n=1 Tax=Cucumis sativus TaxID=3659 RepID=A0A0A0KJ20_CUCSA|nr:HVA22-like protein k isoform X2 [Cucumis sativus]
MAFLGSVITNEVGLQLLLYPLNSNAVVRTACCSIGIVLPVYSTFKAIEKKDQNDQQKWLIYWAAYGSLSLVEAYSDKFLSWVPVYYHLKFAFLVWLQLPATSGAKKLYMNYLRPFLLKHQGKVDWILGYASDEMTNDHQGLDQPGQTRPEEAYKLRIETYKLRIETHTQTPT